MPRPLILLFGVLILLGPVGGLLIGVSDSGSPERTLGFVLLGLFFLGGIALNVVAVRRSRRS
jgi:hypothetical protein